MTHRYLTQVLAAVLAVGSTAAGSDGPTVEVSSTEYDESISIHLAKSAVIDTPWNVTKASITQPEIADVQVLSPQQLVLTGIALGSTDLILWSEAGSWHARVDVIVDLSFLKEEIKKAFPDAEIVTTQSHDVLLVSGSLRRAEQVPQLRKLLDSYGVKYVDMTSVAGIQQVLLQVRIAEASRNAIKALGINAFYAGEDAFGGLTIGSANGGALNPVDIGVPKGAAAAGSLPFQFLAETAVSASITMFGGIPDWDLEFFIQSLAENQYLRILAEPTLVALSGEEASFLAGGEYPIPVVQAATTGSSSITIEYKEFGVSLRFRPTVLGDGTIRLEVAPEISELSDVGAVEIQGFRIPSLTTRKSETTIEIQSGQSFAMAGLINDVVAARNSRLPLLGDLPILGTLFRSVRYERRETEMVVLVTATLAEPMSTATARPLPGGDWDEPSDWDIYVDGRFQGRGPLPKKPTDVDSEWFRQMGLNRLRGPGAWADYGVSRGGASN
jgi:pilus assembly protein CpaC